MNTQWKNVILATYGRLENNKLLMAVRRGMLLALPVIMTGSISLMFLSIPIPSYEQWLQKLWGGAAVDFLTTVHSVTLGCISLVVLITISVSFEEIYAMRMRGLLPLVSICSYVAWVTGGDMESLSQVFLSTWLFYAIVCVCISCKAFLWLQQHLPKIKRMFADGENADFINAISSVIPGTLIVAGFTVFNKVLVVWLGSDNLQTAFVKLWDWLFLKIGNGILSGLLFLFLMHFMWFFGIHGSNVLDNVARNIFNNGLDINTALISDGNLPTEIISKSFMDTFVLFGGCGTILCLVVAILLAEKRKSVRRLTKIAMFPALFNMNELLLFGLPIVLNPIFMLPFIVTPLILFMISYLASAAGLVPIVIHAVEWTTPIFLSGYAATDSIAGSVLQLVNLIVGIFVYMPFVKLAYKSYHIRLGAHIKELTAVTQEKEAVGMCESLTTLGGNLGATAKTLADGLMNAIDNGEISMFYQPQMDQNQKVMGAEALLRWKYQSEMYIYPPLVIALAEETGQMDELGTFIVSSVCRDLEIMNKEFDKPLLISINLTAVQVTDGKIFGIIKEELAKYNLEGKQLGLEITEHAALQFSAGIIERLEEMRRFGTPIIMDDFGMGHSSMVYLRENQFDLVKLDGSVVKDILNNKRSRDIISSIIYLSKSLDFDVLAEYVESNEQQKVLEELGCFYYQGYLFGKAEPLEQFMKIASNIELPGCSDMKNLQSKINDQMELR